MAHILKDCRVSCKLSWGDIQALCCRERLVCKQLSVTKNNFYDYEVEYLCNYKKYKGREFFLVKWKGYAECENTWEPLKNLKCPILLDQFRQDMETALLEANEPLDSSSLSAPSVSILLKKVKQRIKLQKWEDLINQTCRQKGRIFVSNDVDLDGPPKDFTYINDNTFWKGVEVHPVTVGCECENCLSQPVNGCCPGLMGHRWSYNDSRQVKVKPGVPIYECNSMCRCGPDCGNRVVQRGIQYDMCIFKTANGRGWGVRTLQRIYKNGFVMEYLGEVITTEEAERRGVAYDKQGVTYLFDLDYVDDVYTVDAAHYGNISHFVNHSLKNTDQSNQSTVIDIVKHKVYNVFIDNLDERLPRIAFFAKRGIKAGEELTFDYKMTVDAVDAESSKMDSDFSRAGIERSPTKLIRMECKCGVKNCRKYLF
ncbi:histone-lysine N-methyltransferase SUV39H1-A-like [Xyrauchen texanus]|uniref:histone-lysine N-methyltransferase SUV39H1-A-like n=1 Tax=Xyrauchen texanus TaxID=154827 RepID=UPI00224273D7|nr:histone-lysine N-methyltransferase SUV39H1-A-like [Xyrauchen texanus]